MLKFRQLTKHYGFSLIAMMISAGIGVFLLLSMMQLIATSRQSYNMNNEIARMHDNARFAINYLTNQISRAGTAYSSSTSGVGFYTATTGDVWPNASTINYADLPNGGSRGAAMYIPGYAYLGCRGRTFTGGSAVTAANNPLFSSANGGFQAFGTSGVSYTGRPDSCAVDSSNFPSLLSSYPTLRFIAMASSSNGNIACLSHPTNNTTRQLLRSTIISNTGTGNACYGGCSLTAGSSSCCVTGYGPSCSALGGGVTYNCGGTEGGSTTRCLTTNIAGTTGVTNSAMIYERLTPVAEDSGSTGTNSSSSLSIYYTNKSSSTTVPNCTNGSVPAAWSGANVGVVAKSTFTIGLWNNTAASDATCATQSSNCIPNLQCTPEYATYTNTTGYTAQTTLPIIEGIEYMKVMVGEDNFGERDYTGNKATSPSRWVELGNSSVDATNIVAIRVGIVVRSANPVLAKASQPTLFVMRSWSGTAATFTPSVADKYLRKVFVFTIPLSNFTHRDYFQPTISGSPSSTISAPNVYPSPATKTYSGTYNGYSTPYNYTNGVDYERHCVGMTAAQIASYPPNGTQSPSTGIAGGFVIKVGGVRTRWLDGENGTQQYLRSGDRCCASDVVETDNLYRYTGSGASSAFQCRVFVNLSPNSSNSCEADRTLLPSNSKCKYFWTVP